MSSAAAQTLLTSHGDPIAPSGAVTELGSSLPLREVVDRSGRWLAVIHGGFDVHGVAIVELATGKIVSRAAVRGAYAAVDFSADDKSLLVGAAGNTLVSLDFDPATGHIGTGRLITVPGLYQTALRALPGGDVLVLTRRVGTPAALGAAASLPSNPMHVVRRKGPGEQFALERIALPDPHASEQVATVRWSVALPGFPSSLTLAPNHRRAYVTAWFADQLSIVDLDRAALVSNVATPAHPVAVAAAPQRGLLYVACAATNEVAVIDERHARVVGTIGVGALPSARLGATPNALALTHDESALYVANADENNIIRVNLDGTGGTVAGAIQVGMYPTDIALSADDATLYVLDGKGLGVTANPLFNPYFTVGAKSWQEILQSSPQTASLANQDFGGRFATRYYVASLDPGILERVDLHRIDETAELHELRARMSRRASETAQLPPVKHVIYILKENRTYDQLLGDDTRGNGDPQLAMFGERITPNIHALVDQFVLADNYRLESEVSAPGWPFAFSAYANDLTQRTWPAAYGAQPLPLGPEGSLVSEPEYEPGGYIWDDALRAGLSVRLYHMPAAMVDPLAAPYAAPSPTTDGLDDAAVFRQWFAEFKAYERNGKLPALEVMPLSGDHTRGTTPYALTPNAYVATNDYYVGRIVDAVSHSRYWRNTVIFTTEDDAQNGPDHVSSERSYFIAAGGYVRRHYVDHTPYSLTGLVRTIEVLLGLPPMTEYDATATIMTSIFSQHPDETAYDVRAPQTNLAARNSPLSVDAALSSRMHFETTDENDPALLNRVLWDYAFASGDLPRSARTAWTPPPPDKNWHDPDDGADDD